MYMELWRRRKLILFMSERQLYASAHRTVLGRLWHLLVPLFQVSIYYFVVVVIFNRGQLYDTNPLLVITMGLMHYQIIHHTIAYSMSSVYENEPFLLQIRIEPAVLIAIGFVKAVRLAMPGIVVYFLVHLASGPELTIRFMLYPLALAALILASWAIALTLGTWAVFFRDLEKLVPIIFQLLMYLSPVIYTAAFVPQEWLYLFFLNPLAVIFAGLQWSVLGQHGPPIQPILWANLSLILMLAIGHGSYAWAARRFTKAF